MLRPNRPCPTGVTISAARGNTERFRPVGPSRLAGAPGRGRAPVAGRGDHSLQAASWMRDGGQCPVLAVSVSLFPDRRPGRDPCPSCRSQSLFLFFEERRSGRAVFLPERSSVLLRRGAAYQGDLSCWEPSSVTWWAVRMNSIRGRGLRKPFPCFPPVPVSRTTR